MFLDLFGNCVAPHHTTSHHTTSHHITSHHHHGNKTSHHQTPLDHRERLKGGAHKNSVLASHWLVALRQSIGKCFLWFISSLPKISASGSPGYYSYSSIYNIIHTYTYLHSNRHPEINACGVPVCRGQLRRSF